MGTWGVPPAGFSQFGTWSGTTYSNSPVSGNWPTPGNGYSISAGGGYNTATATGSITPTLVWTPAAGKSLTTDPPPASVTALEGATASWSLNSGGSGTRTGYSASDGLGDTATPASSNSGQTSSGTTVVTSTNINTATGVATFPAVSLSAASPSYQSGVGMYGAGLALSITLTPVTPATISLTGPIPDPNNNNALNILIGQGCSAALTGLAAGYSVVPGTYKWRISGNTYQSWTAGTSSGGPTGQADPYTTNVPSPIWFWSDNAGGETVTCSATASNGTSSYTVGATANVILQVPTWSETDQYGVTRIDSSDPAISGVALWAGPIGTVINGSEWWDSLKTPSLFASQGAGAWAHLQIITVNGTTTVGGVPQNVPNAGQTGLDGAFPYSSTGSDFLDNGSVGKEGDSPGIGLSDTATNYTLNYSWDLYVMYFPPSGAAGSDWVPVTKLTWTWAPNVNEPKNQSGQLTWTAWNPGTAPGGNPNVPGAGSRYITEPSWTTVINGTR